MHCATCDTLVSASSESSPGLWGSGYRRREEVAGVSVHVDLRLASFHFVSPCGSGKYETRVAFQAAQPGLRNLVSWCPMRLLPETAKVAKVKGWM